MRFRPPPEKSRSSTTHYSIVIASGRDPSTPTSSDPSRAPAEYLFLRLPGAGRNASQIWEMQGMGNASAGKSKLRAVGGAGSPRWDEDALGFLIAPVTREAFLDQYYE